MTSSIIYQKNGMKSKVLFFSIILLTIWSHSSLWGQELNFKVTVDKLPIASLQKSDPNFMKILAKKVEEFMNNTKWGDDEFKDYEKIKGNMLIVITEELSDRVYKADLSLQTERPVFNSTYVTPMLNIQDKNITFTFDEMTFFQKTINTFTDNLSAVLSYYAFMTLGLDYDSFRANSGDPFYKKAQEIILSLPPNVASDDGWKSIRQGDKNRYWLNENLQNPLYRQFRQAFYEYHRHGLDGMYSEPDKSRAVILSALTAIGQVNLDVPNSYLVQAFCDAKSYEIIEIFKVADRGQKDKVRSIMSDVDVIRKRDYEVLR